MCRKMGWPFGAHFCAEGCWRMKAFFRFLIIFGFLALLLPANPAEAKGNGRVAGNVKSISGSPLRDAVIKIFQIAQQGQTILTTRSDSRGFFRSASLHPGDYYLEVTRPGYQPVTTNSFTIDPGRTTSLDIVLQEFIDYISNDEDPRNWELKTVMRSSSDRRLIFRGLPGDPLPDSEYSVSQFQRSGAMSIASSSALNGESYLAGPQSSQNGVTSNFAFTEPLSQHSRMILTGQLDFGNGSFWRLRNSFNYRPDKDHDYRVSVGYGRMSTNYRGSDTISPQLLSGELEWRQPAVQTIALGMEGNTKFFDLLAIKYGFDNSRLHYGESRGFFYPSVQILITPLDGWCFRALSTSQRLSDINSVLLPDGEILNLSEPTFITMFDGQVSMNQVRHSEIAAQRTLAQDTTVEVAVYQDRAHGPGIPVMVTTITPSEQMSHMVELGEDRSSQRGLRVTVSRKLLDFLTGSIAYGYGTAASISGLDALMLTGSLDESLLSVTQTSNQHALTGRIDATLPVTKTNLMATVRWYPGNPLTPIDWFSDRLDIGTKSTNLEIRQALPLPEFISNTGHWEILIDLRNVLNQGKEVIPTADGEIVLNRNPRSLRFGLSMNFR